MIPTDQKTPLQELVKIKYDAPSDQYKKCLDARVSLEPHLSYPQGRSIPEDSVVIREQVYDRHLARAGDLLASLTAVDGAVLMTKDLLVLGFGVEILGSDDTELNQNIPIEVSKWFDPDPKPLSSFGMRHRSAYRFCKQIPGSIAFVVSQDGDLTVFANLDADMKCFKATADEP